MDESDLKKAKNLVFSSDIDALRVCNFYIITVPTPININNQPNLRPLISASNTVAKILKKNDIVVYESTVYPGATEEDCVPILEKVSKLSLNKDFYVGYSPERINPGDQNHTIHNVTKVVSGSNQKALKKVVEIYRTFMGKNLCFASSIEVAETAKVIKNIVYQTSQK